MELLQLRYFQTIARYESVTLAARHFNIPQSSMSQSLIRLEKELGVKLFERKKNRLFLNEKGKQFLSNIETSLTALDNGIESIIDLPNRIRGPIRVLVMENSRFVIQCASEFTKLHSDVSFYICHDHYSDNDSEYDLCISANPYFGQMREKIPLIREQIVLAVCDDHPLSQRKKISISELRNEKFITTSTRSNLYKITMKECRACGFEPQLVISCDDSYYIRKYIAENIGIAFAPSVSWAGRFRENTRIIPIIDPPIFSTSYLLWNAQRYQNHAVKEFSEFLKEKSKNVEGNLVKD